MIYDDENNNTSELEYDKFYILLTLQLKNNWELT